MVEEQDDLTEWTEGIDFEKFMKKVKKSGLPEEIVDAIEDGLEDLEDELD